MGKKGELLKSNHHGNENGGHSGTDSHKDDIYCGIGAFRPHFIQGCANIGCLTAALCFAGLASSTLSIYITSQITTLERQFGFSSSVSGLLLSCNDFGYLLTTLLMSYLARRIHIPRALSVSMMLFGISGIFCAIPFFASQADLPAVSELSYLMNASTTKAGVRRMFDGSLCQHTEREFPVSSLPPAADAAITTGSNASLLPEDNSCDNVNRNRPRAISEDWQGVAVGFIAIGMVFQGFGKSCRQPFIGTYIDDNVPKIRTTFYLGIVMATSILGPVLAFALGGLFSKIYLTLEETAMTPVDPRWVGAWWLGFLAFGILGILSALPTLCFPRRLRPQPYLQQLEQERKLASKGRQSVHDLKEFAKSIFRLLRTPVYMCLVMSTCITIFGISGLVSFMPKYVETQFLIPAWQANIVLGLLSIVAASVGSLTSGIITSRFKLSPRTCLKVVLVIKTIACLVGVASFFLGCDQPYISMGASSGLQPSDAMTSNITTCSSSCGCDDRSFFPVCGADGVTYFSPCHAGCTEKQGMMYKSCSCINITMVTPSSNLTTEGPVPEARPGFCTSDCNMLYPYAVLSFIGGFVGTLAMMPTFVVTIRSVSEADKPLAIGLSAFLSTLIGFLPGPVVFGRIIDSTCLLWSSGCIGSGSCSQYSLVEFRYKYQAMALGTTVASCLLYGLALILATLKPDSFKSHSDDGAVKATLDFDGEKLMLDKFHSRDNALGADDEETFVPRGKIYKGANKVKW